MRTRQEDQRSRKPEEKLSPALEAELRARERGEKLLRDLEPPVSEMCAVFRSISPKLDSKLFGDIVARFSSSMIYAVSLSEHLRELACIKGRSRRADLKLLLEVMLDGSLAGQRRQIEGLRRDIPRLVKQLEPRNTHKAKARRTSRETMGKPHVARHPKGGNELLSP